jgi:hypothetical protein
MAKKKSGRLSAIEQEYKKKDRFVRSGRSYLNEEALTKYQLELFRSKARSSDDPDAQNYIIIVPPPDEGSYFGFRLAVHYDIGGRGNFVCLDQQMGQACPVCMKLRQLRKAKAADDEMVRALKPKIRYLFFVIDDRDQEGRDRGVQLYDAPQTVNREILALSKDTRTGDYIDISDPEHGKCLRFEKSGQKEKTRYSGFTFLDRDPLDMDLLKNLPTFDELIDIASFAEIKEALEGAPDDSEDDEESDEESDKDEKTDEEEEDRREEEEDKDKEEAEPVDQEDPKEDRNEDPPEEGDTQDELAAIRERIRRATTKK